MSIRRVPAFLAVLITAACGAEDSGDELATPNQCREDPASCAPFAVSWTFYDSNIDRLSCADIDVDAVEFEVTPAGGDSSFTSFDCSAMEGLTPPVIVGAYTGRVRLFTGGSMVAASHAETTTVEGGSPERLFFDFDCTPDCVPSEDF